MKLVYFKTEDLDLKTLTYHYTQWKLSADNREVKRSWQVKYSEEKGSTFFPVEAPDLPEGL